MQIVSKTDQVALYTVPALARPNRQIVLASTKHSQRICNEPRCAGVDYTNALEASCTLILKELRNTGVFKGTERETSVLHILRGGLNFGLRQAIHEAFDWNLHSSTFVSAQRRQAPSSQSAWEIIENSYHKFPMSPVEHIVFGDVVATGTSLAYALDLMASNWLLNSPTALQSITFFTIGGPNSHQAFDRWVDKLGLGDVNITIVYLEGIFCCPDQGSALRIKLPGTDLVRRDAILTPEFIESNYLSPHYPLERCAIYDAGSRSFDWAEYSSDINSYWSEVLQLAENGLTFAELLAERFPVLDPKRFGPVNLSELCKNRLTLFPLLTHGQPNH